MIIVIARPNGSLNYELPMGRGTLAKDLQFAQAVGRGTKMVDEYDEPWKDIITGFLLACAALAFVIVGSVVTGIICIKLVNWAFSG